MSAISASKSSVKPLGIIALIVLLSCWGLFLLDKETHSIGDLFTSGNLVALLVYFIPTLLVTFILYLLFQQRNNYKKSVMLAAVIGVPVSFALIITWFYLI